MKLHTQVVLGLTLGAAAAVAANALTGVIYVARRESDWDPSTVTAKGARLAPAA